MLAVLSPTTPSLGPVFLEQLRGAMMGAPLPLGESLIIAWPQTVALIASTIVLFVAGYVVFQRSGGEGLTAQRLVLQGGENSMGFAVRSS